MSPRAATDGLMPWAISILGLPAEPAMPDLAIVAGDASNRRYFRARLGGVSYVLVEAPPATEKNEAFLTVRGLLAAAGVTVPALFGADLERGFLLLVDDEGVIEVACSRNFAGDAVQGPEAEISRSSRLSRAGS